MVFFVKMMRKIDVIKISRLAPVSGGRAVDIISSALLLLQIPVHPYAIYIYYSKVYPKKSLVLDTYRNLIL